MADPQDGVEFSWQPGGAPEPAPLRRTSMGRPWLSVWFNCCQTYGRMYRNDEATMYQGRCPRCGAGVRAMIGPGGTSRRMFETS